MKRTLFLFTINFLLFAFFNTGFSQTWTQTGPTGANIVKFAITTDKLVTVSSNGNGNNSGGIWLSSDNGSNWEYTTTNLPNKRIVYAAGAIGNNIFVSVNATNIAGQWQADGGIYRSADYGVTWTLVKTASPLYTAFSSFYTKGTTIFAGGSGYGSGPGGVFRSTNYGTTWTLSGNGLNSTRNKQVYCFESINDTIFIGTGDGIYRSTNNGTNWAKFSTGMTIPLYGNVTGLTKINNTLFASTSFGVYKSTDKAVSWSEINNGLSDLRNSSIYADGNTLYLGSYLDGIFKSVNGGDVWYSASSGLPKQNTNCIVKKDNILFVGGSTGVFYSIDNGQNWFDRNNGIYGQPIGIMVKLNNNVFLGSNGVFRSSDNCETWQSVTNEILNDATDGMANIQLVGNTVFATTAYNTFTSNDWGNSWSFMNEPDSIDLFDILGFNNRLFGFGQQVTGMGYKLKIFFSDNLGSTWDTITNIPFAMGFKRKEDDIFAIGKDDIYSTTINFYRSVNGTEPFTLMGSLPNSDGYNTVLGVLGDTLFAENNYDIYKSTDNGITFTSAGNNLIDSTIEGFATYQNTLFTRTAYRVYARNNSTGNWIDITSNIPLSFRSGINCVYADENYLYTGVGSRSLFKVPTTQIMPPVQPISINGNNTPCLYSTQTYSVTNVQGETYSWAIPVGWGLVSGQGTNSIVVIIMANSGNLTVTPSNIFGIGQAQTLTVTPSTIPSQPDIITGPINPTQNTSQIYSVNNVTGVTYNWTFPTDWVQTAGGTSNSVTVTVGIVAGNVTCTPSNDCGNGTASTLAVVPSGVGINEFNESNYISIFPNPTNGIVAITFQGLSDNVQLQLQNIQGGLIYSTSFNDISDNFTKTLDLSKYPNGMYYIQVKCDGKTFIQKLVKQ